MRATRHTPHTACHTTPHATRHTPHATCHMPPATQHTMQYGTLRHMRRLCRHAHCTDCKRSVTGKGIYMLAKLKVSSEHAACGGAELQVAALGGAKAPKQALLSRHLGPPSRALDCLHSLCPCAATLPVSYLWDIALIARPLLVEALWLQDMSTSSQAAPRSAAAAVGGARA